MDSSARFRKGSRVRQTTMVQKGVLACDAWLGMCGVATRHAGLGARLATGTELKHFRQVRQIRQT